MSRILGLDLGTNSIGWAVVKREWNPISKKENFNLIDKGVRVFPEGYDKDSYGNDQSRAKQRTDKRGPRRLKFRRKLRKYETLKVLVNQDSLWCPLSKSALEKWRCNQIHETGKSETFRHFPKEEEFLSWLKTDEATNKNPYYFRDKFSRKKYGWENNPSIAQELGRAFYHLAQRRGFLSNRLGGDEGTEAEKKAAHMLSQLDGIHTSDEFKQLVETEFNALDESDKELEKLKKYFVNRVKDFEKNRYETEENGFNTIKRSLESKLGKVKEGIHDLTQKIKDENCTTLGQYFYTLYTSDRHDRDNKIRGNYTAREEHYEAEFEKICSVQGITGDLKDKLYNAIFYQRPLKSQKGLVGKCSFEKNKPRCPVSHPDYEERRALDDINKIKYRRANDEMKQLEDEDKKHIWRLFFRKSKKQFEFKEIADALNKLHGKELEFNYRKRFYKTSIAGCPTTAGLMNLFGKDWELNDYQDRSWIDILENPLWKSMLYEAYQGDKSKRKRKYTDRSKNKYEKTDTVIGTKDIADLVDEIWHALFFFDKKERLKVFAINKLGLNEKQSSAFSSLSLKRDYGSLSLKAIRKLLPLLREGLLFSHAAFLAKIPDLLPPHIWEENQNLITKEVGNIIKNHSEEQRKCRLVNNLITKFKAEFNHNHQDYRLDEQGKKTVRKKVKSVYGHKRFYEKPEEEQQEIINWTEQTFERQIQKNKHLKINRLDEQIKKWLLAQDTFELDEDKLQQLYHPSAIEIYAEPERNKEDGNLYLGQPDIPAIKNPVVMRMLHQLKEVVNTLIKEDKIDEDTVIHIEMAREINNANMRAAIKKYQDERKEENEQFKEILIGLFKIELDKSGYEPEDEDYKKIRAWSEQNKDQGEKLFELIKGEKNPVKKYRLWREQEGICIYSNKRIPLYQLFDGISFEIEHTIPKSKSYDNSMENLTVCDSEFNRQKKRNRIPSELDNHEEILLRIEKWKEKYEHYDDLIEQAKKRSVAAQTKEAKDRAVQDKNLFILHRNYWKGKYERFTMQDVPEGFIHKNMVDTGIITKYARAYLASVFNRKKVHCVNGTLVDQFRKSWGLHDIYYDKKGVVQFKKKDRSNHIHHCIDAVVVACMTKNKYDELAKAWRAGEWNEEGNRDLKKQQALLKTTKPWKNFTQDMKMLKEEVLVSHDSKNSVGKQTKKKLRKQGKIAYTNKLLLDKHGNPVPLKGKQLHPGEVDGKIEGKDYFKTEKDGIVRYYEFARYKNGTGDIVYHKIPVYQQGETIRGSLHKETFYGKTKQPERIDGKLQFDKNGHIKLKKDKKGDDKFIYVVRKELTKLKRSDVDNIIDPVVREKIRTAAVEKIITFSTTGANVKEKVWMNEGKRIEIKKVRIESRVKNPLEIKAQKDKRSGKNKKRHEWKEKYYAQTDGNVLMALYSDGENRDFELVNTFDFAKLREFDHGLYPPYKEKTLHRKVVHIPLMQRNGKDIVLKPGIFVLIHKEEEDYTTLHKFPEEKWQSRLYVIRAIDEDGIKLYHHQEARGTVEVIKHMNDAIDKDNAAKNIVDKNGKIKKSKLTTPKGGMEIFDNPEKFPYIKFKVGNFNALIEGIDFKITPVGKIEPA